MESPAVGFGRSGAGGGVRGEVREGTFSWLFLTRFSPATLTPQPSGGGGGGSQARTPEVPPLLLGH